MTEKSRRFKRPTTKEKLDLLEVRGFWKAIAKSRRVAETHTKVTLETVKEIHGLIFSEAIPEIAGRFRKDGEDIKELECAVPPPGRVVTEKMYEFWREFDRRLSLIRQANHVPENSTQTWLDEVFDLSAWTQYQITLIHPFCNGNGRMGRIMTNIVLIWFGLPPSPIKIESEDKDGYLRSLCQIDKYEDYEPLKKVILRGALQTLEKEERARRNAIRG